MTTVEDADSCLTLAKREEFDLALLDYNLGCGKTGEDVAHELRSLFPRMPLIMLSGYPVPDSAKESVDRFFAKGSSSPADLLDAIESLVPDCSLARRMRTTSVQWKDAGEGEITDGGSCYLPKTRGESGN